MVAHFSCLVEVGDVTLLPATLRAMNPAYFIIANLHAIFNHIPAAQRAADGYQLAFAHAADPKPSNTHYAARCLRPDITTVAGVPQPDCAELCYFVAGSPGLDVAILAVPQGVHVPFLRHKIWRGTAETCTSAMQPLIAAKAGAEYFIHDAARPGQSAIRGNLVKRVRTGKSKLIEMKLGDESPLTVGGDCGRVLFSIDLVGNTPIGIHRFLLPDTRTVRAIPFDDALTFLNTALLQPQTREWTLAWR
jgi:hypothetical protein